MSGYGVTVMSAEPTSTRDQTTSAGAAAKAADEAWHTPRPDEIVAVPGVPRMLDNGVAWLRTEVELARAFAAIEAAIAQIVGNGLPNEWEYWDMIERARFGVYNVARWSLGMIEKSPMGQGMVPVTGGSLCRELDRAHLILRARGESWEYALGVATWLTWITGVDGNLVLPGEQPDPRG
jgi:hypothetical protein